MEKMIKLEISESEATELERMLVEVVCLLRQSNDEFEARKPLIEARSAQRDATLKQIDERLAYVRSYLRTPISLVYPPLTIELDEVEEYIAAQALEIDRLKLELEKERRKHSSTQ